MASRNFRKVEALTREIKMLEGYVTFGASGAVVAATTSCNGFSIARTDVGDYLITLADRYALFMGAVLNELPADALGTNEKWRVVAQTMASKTIQIKHVDMDTPAEVDPAEGDKLFIVLYLGNSPDRRA